MTNPVPDRPDEHDESEPEWVECEKCSGRGYFSDEVLDMDAECSVCHGSGTMLNPALSDYEQACALYNRNRY